MYMYKYIYICIYTSVLQMTMTTLRKTCHCSATRCVPSCCSVLQCVAVCCSVLQCVEDFAADVDDAAHNVLLLR